MGGSEAQTGPLGQVLQCSRYGQWGPRGHILARTYNKKGFTPQIDRCTHMHLVLGDGDF